MKFKIKKGKIRGGLKKVELKEEGRDGRFVNKWDGARVNRVRLLKLGEVQTLKRNDDNMEVPSTF